MLRARASRYGFGAALGCVVALVACTSPGAPAGLEVVISSNLSAPTQYDAIRVEVSQQTNGGAWDEIFDNSFRMPGGTTLPATLAIAPGTSPDQDALIRVTAYSGFMGDSDRGTVRVVAAAQLQIPLTRVVELNLELTTACINVVCTNPDQDCQPDGKCASDVIDSSKLPTYAGTPESTLDGGNECTGAACTSSGIDSGARPDAGGGPGRDSGSAPHADAAIDAADDTSDAARDSGEDSADDRHDAATDTGEGDGHDGGHDATAPDGSSQHDSGPDAPKDTGSDAPHDSGSGGPDAGGPADTGTHFETGAIGTLSP